MLDPRPHIICTCVFCGLYGTSFVVCLRIASVFSSFVRMKQNHGDCLCLQQAIGDYTRVITDFSAFPIGAKEGRIGSYWFHEGSQANFDDVDHYRMIKAMCRLSCSLCDKSVEEQGSESTKRKNKFRHIEQLKGHLYHNHRMVMCSLCLEGRKVNFMLTGYSITFQLVSPCISSLFEFSRYK